MSKTSYAEVAFPIPLKKTFHYRLPQDNDDIPVGSRVLVPFGPRKNLVGYVLGHTSEKPSFPTKEIIEKLDTAPFINGMLLELARWVSDHYLCSLGEALACIAPPALAAPKRQRVGEEAGKRVSEEVSRRVGENQEQGVPYSPTHLLTYSRKLTVEQQRALTPLLAAVDAKAFQPFLLRGVTSSGKTELYLRTMQHVLAQGRQALYLLPEIALTPPFFDQLKETFGEEKVGIWHSGLSGGERYRTWTGVRDGTIKVILGARSAVFAPFTKLGLIVLDEEHEGAYKQEDSPRYHTREVALKRAELSAAVLLMGSATPSLESYWHAQQGTYTLLELTSRVEEKEMPPVELIDRRGGDKRQARLSIFSEPLKLAIEQRLARQEQILLFVNRRGFTPFLRCSACGWVSRCERCSMTMTLHHGKRVGEEASKQLGENQKPGVPYSPTHLLTYSPYMQCHTCSRRDAVPIQCPQCKRMKLRQFGIGTQKVEEELKRLFPFVKSARLDRDIGQFRKNFEKTYRDFEAQKLDVLIGTQMIAKGFDFPHVTLVGVVDADVSLHLPDFRSAERTFDLLTQVAGRTGRGKSKGIVLVQTEHSEHYAFETAKNHDYVKFYQREIEDRKRLNYPPACRLINIVIRATKEENASQAADVLADKLEESKNEGTQILGPAPAPYSRVRNQYRYQVLLKGSAESLQASLKFLRSYKSPKSYLTVDVDPIDLL